MAPEFKDLSEFIVPGKSVFYKAALLLYLVNHASEKKDDWAYFNDKDIAICLIQFETISFKVVITTKNGLFFLTFLRIDQTSFGSHGTIATYQNLEENTAESILDKIGISLDHAKGIVKLMSGATGAQPDSEHGLFSGNKTTIYDNDKEVEVFSYKRLTRKKDQANASSLEIAIPSNVIQLIGNYKLLFRYRNLEIGENPSFKHVVRDGKDKITKSYYSLLNKALDTGFVEAGHEDYIPEWANSSNWNFDLNMKIGENAAVEDMDYLDADIRELMGDIEAFSIRRKRVLG
jgi:hypothetical protein